MLRDRVIFPCEQIDYPEIVEGIAPRHRFMAAYEQKVEPPDRKWQYLLFAAEPYETIAFKVRFYFSDEQTGHELRILKKVSVDLLCQLNFTRFSSWSKYLLKLFKL